MRVRVRVSSNIYLYAFIIIVVVVFLLYFEFFFVVVFVGWKNAKMTFKCCSQNDSWTFFLFPPRIGNE